MAHTKQGMKKAALIVGIFAASLTLAHEQQSFAAGETQTWLAKYGKQIDRPFSGPLTFSHAEYAHCLEDESATFDTAILGMPFDTGTSYRPGARFGPHAIRSGSRRQRAAQGYTLAWGNNPYDLGLKILDCGDVCLQCDAVTLPIYLVPRSRSYLLTMRLQ